MKRINHLSKIIKMKINKIISLVALLVAGFQLSHAQQLPAYSNYFLNPFYYNPARAGTDLDGGRINLGFQKLWDRIPESPVSTYGSWDGRIKDSNMALGATIYHDRTTKNWQNTGGSLAYAYHLPFKKDKTHFLSFGLQAGVNSINIGAEGFNPFMEGDPSVISSRSVNFDLSVGINYHWKGLNVGFSVPQVLGNKITFRRTDPNYNSGTRIQRQYIAHVSYDAKLGKKKDWTLAPHVMANVVDKNLSFLDITLMAKYKQLAWVALGYTNGGGLKPVSLDGKNSWFSPNASGLHATAGVGIKELVDLSYTYKSTFGKKGDLTMANLGSTHEITFTFRLKRKTDKSEFDENKKRTDDEIAKVNQKADDNAKKIDEVDAKADSLGQALAGVQKTAEDAKAASEKNTADIQQVNSRLDNIVYKKFGSVYFEVDKHELTDEAKASIDAFKSKLAEMKGNYFIYLAGNASTEGSQIYNQALSAKRCDAVKRYLEGIGISQRVLLLPYGENSSVTEKQTKEEDRAQNRRVDIYLSGE
jgi:type IX secretion system PorP/SprF family membrane protein